MALTKTPIELSSTPGIVDNSNATAITIDSSENVGIGTSSPTLSAAWNQVLHVQSAGAGSSIRLADSTSGTSGDVGLLIGQYSNSSYIINRDSSNMYFWTGGQERVRIDSSGNLLVGTTDDVVWNNSANSAADNGHNLRDDGRAGFAYYNATANSNATVNINRTGSDGDLIRLFKSGSSVGSIGTNVGRLSIGSGDTGVLFAGDIDAIYPANGIAARDSAIDLGVSGARFKDLYLSGGVVFGTTGGAVSSKTLDDYEEGTWTPVIAGSGGGAYTYSASATARYTKIGNLVTLSAAITNITTNGGGHAGYVQIQGAPFNKNSSTFATGAMELSSGYMGSGQTFATVSFISSNSGSVMYIRQSGDSSGGADFPVTGINSGNTDFNFIITYQTA